MHYVMLSCRAGTMTLRDAGSPGMYWEHDLHVVTWCSESTKAAANETARELRLGDPAHRQIRRVWVEERNECSW